MLQKNNNGHSVAIQSLVKQFKIGLFFNNMHELKQQLQDKKMMREIRNNVWQQRHLFTFDYHVDELVNFFKKVINQTTEKIVEEKEVPVLPLIA